MSLKHTGWRGRVRQTCISISIIATSYRWWGWLINNVSNYAAKASENLLLIVMYKLQSWVAVTYRGVAGFSKQMQISEGF